MTLDERLEKRIEIAARLAGAIVSGPQGASYGGPLGIANIALMISDAIIDTAIGDMTVEPK